MLLAHRRAAAGDTMCCRSSSCLYALDVINRAEERVITCCQPVAELVVVWNGTGSIRHMLPENTPVLVTKHAA